nr:MAG TPA: YodL-like protein [Caudoviricetes sp.]
MKLFNNEAPSETRTSSLSVEDVLLHFFEDELRILHMKIFNFVSY